MKPTIKLSKFEEDYSCEVCHKAKQSCKPFSISSHKSAALFDLVHTDVWGSYSVESHDGSRFFLTLVDDYSKATWVFLMSSKSQVGELIAYFCTLVQTQFRTVIKVFISDNGTEYVNNSVNTLFRKLGILHQTSCVETPQ